MPTYDYVCTHCEHEFEAMQSMKDDPLTECDACGEPALRRKISAGAGIIFRGSGFYETDYKRPQSSGNGASGSAESGDAAKGSSESGSSGGDGSSKKEGASSGSSSGSSATSGSGSSE